MKKLVLIITAGLLLSGAAYAKDENGALGLGIMTESSNKGIVSGSANSIRGTLFLDAGSQLFGPFFYGFEFQGDVKKLSQNNADFTSKDVSIFGMTDGEYQLWIVQATTNKMTITNTLWDLDFSPRGYISFDLGNKIQLLGFGGLNINWQTADYQMKVTQGTWTKNGVTYGRFEAAGDTYSSSTSIARANPWNLIAGARISVGAFYLDYTRFLQANDTGDYSFNQFNKDRFSLGLNLRF